MACCAHTEIPPAQGPGQGGRAPHGVPGVPHRAQQLQAHLPGTGGSKR